MSEAERGKHRPECPANLFPKACTCPPCGEGHAHFEDVPGCPCSCHRVSEAENLEDKALKTLSGMLKAGLREAEVQVTGLSEDARILADQLIARGIGKSDAERVAIARVLDAFQARARSEGERLGAQRERERVVKYLRRGMVGRCMRAISGYAMAIKRGDHEEAK